MSKNQNSASMPISMFQDFSRFIQSKGYTFQFNLLNGYDVINKTGRIMSKSTVSKLRRQFLNITTKNENDGTKR